MTGPLKGSPQAWRDAAEELPSVLQPEQPPTGGPLSDWWRREVARGMRDPSDPAWRPLWEGRWTPPERPEEEP